MSDTANQHRFEGCLLGLALGDAMGAPFEGGPVERLVWRLIGKTQQGAMRWTDDTQMTLNLAESLIAKGVLDLDDIAARFAADYRWSRGYGPGAARVLKRVRRGADWKKASRSVYAEGSFGNGGAMRAPAVGLMFSNRPEQLLDAARRSAQITHAHPLGIEGAVLIASAVAAALGERSGLEIVESAAAHCTLEPFVERLKRAMVWLRDGEDIAPRDVVSALGNGISAAESCVTAVYIAARFHRAEFEDLLDFTRTCGGDVDTIGAMAGAVWGASHGASRLPVDALSMLEDCDRIRAVARSLCDAVV